MGPILFDGRFVPRFRSKYICRAISFRACQLDIDLMRLSFSLAANAKPTHCLLRRCASRAFGSIPTLCEAMSLLRAQHVVGLLAFLEFLQNEICARLRVFRSRGGPSLSHASLWDRACGRARRPESVLPTV